ncbi:efflux RND transporter periplasmic adaptor subunit [Magnetococcus sp. PR-3]|uniref:efflux RND transporter periplasmic adaptor subunit n=1 Tax=Magnetococcus sp. PR-3 TaxID=3120355 RepID=UPI002FCE2F61
MPRANPYRLLLLAPWLLVTPIHAQEMPPSPEPLALQPMVTSPYKKPEVIEVPAADDSGFEGIVHARYMTSMGFPSTGKIMGIIHREGESVEKDTLILHQDTQVEWLEVKRRELLWKSKAELQAARQRFNVAKTKRATARQLFSQGGSISREDKESADLEYDLAKTEIKRLKTIEAREKLEYELAVVNLERRRIRAPFSGIISQLNTELGSSVESNRAVVQLVDLSHCNLVTNIEERTARLLRNGQPLTVALNDGIETIYVQGHVRFIAPVIDPASGLMEVKVRFTNPNNRIRPGSSGRFFLPKAAAPMAP